MIKSNFTILNILLYSFLLLIVGCKKDNSNKNIILSGHFLISHDGEQNKSVPPLLIKTNKDTTYFRIIKYSNGNGPDHSEFNRLDIWDRDIEDCDVLTYSKLKSVIVEYNKNNKVEPNYESGTFKIDLMDNLDTLSFLMYRSRYTASFFEELEEIARENNLGRAQNRFEKYKNMQFK